MTDESIPSFMVSPLNDFQPESHQAPFDWVDDILIGQTFMKPSTDGIKNIELRKYRTGPMRYILEQIQEDACMPAPSPYVLGLGVQHHDAMKEYPWVVSLDTNNLLHGEEGAPCFLSLDNEDNILGLAHDEGVWEEYWWFAVIRKES